MINEIYEALEFVYGEDADIHVAEALLLLVENNGMLPPQNKEQIEEDEYLGMDGVCRVSELKWDKE